VKACSLILALCLLAGASARGGEEWRSQVTAAPAGKFTDLPSIAMHFSFGWSNVLKAAEADATIRRKGSQYHAVVGGKTDGLARALWPLDAQHTATIQASPLKPIRMAQIERYRKSTIETQVRYDATGLDRYRKVTPTKTPPKWKRVNFAPVYDVISGVLYVRSQPLRIGDKIGVICFPGDSPYIAVVTVKGRENIKCMGKSRPALKLGLEVRKLEVKDKKPTTAVAYEKFKSGTIWVSDDELRLPLRAEVSIFVGFVYGELTGYERL
jgi:hypothetical protein